MVVFSSSLHKKNEWNQEYNAQYLIMKIIKVTISSSRSSFSRVPRSKSQTESLSTLSIRCTKEKSSWHCSISIIHLSIHTVKNPSKATNLSDQTLCGKRTTMILQFYRTAWRQLRLDSHRNHILAHFYRRYLYM